MSEVRIAAARPDDAATVAALRRALWPDADDDPPLGREDALVLLARDAAGAAIGFAEAVIRRDHVNGCDTRPVAFLEGLYVAPGWRRRGVGRGLVEAIAAWARGRGLVELASDALASNRRAHAVHRGCGFGETERVLFFRRAL